MTAAPSALEHQATTLGKYRLIAELGRGGMASVYLSVLSGPAGFSKLTVVKEIRPELADDSDFLTMFLDEARLAARLSHPNIVQTNEVGRDGARYFIAMEYLDGQPYSRLVSRMRERPLPLSAHVHILADVLSGLHHAHELCDYDGKPLDVVHRDATPQNVFITYDGQVKLVDFGIAKAVTSTSETATGVMKGKISYMAPEQARGERVDRRADLFSVGVMLWEAIANRRMWKGVTDIVVLQRLVAGDMPSLEGVVPDVPPRLAAVVRRALSRSAKDRFATALDMRAELEGVLAELGESMPLREAGRLLAEAFQEHRAKLRLVIEKQLVSLRADQQAAMVDALPLVEPPTALTHSDFGRNGREDPSGREVSHPSAVSGTRTAALVPNAPAPTRRSPGLPIVVALGTALLVGGALALSLGTSESPPAPAVVAPTPTYLLTLGSSPPGASVKEGDRFLGTTPVDLPLAPDQTDVRTFVLEKPGFVPYSVSQPPSQGNVQVIATLTPVVAAPSASASAAPEPAATRATTRTVTKPALPATPPPAASDKLNIRTKR
jgi:serine/threonine protein kinase